MKRRLIIALLTGFCASLARADFNPVALTPSSYTLDIVVPKETTEGLPYCINVTAGNGTGLGDNTYYEQGLHSRAGQAGFNSGIPVHNTVFTNINNANMMFLMPPDYTANNTLMIDSVFTSGTLTFTTPTTATNLAILNCGGGGTVTVGYTVTHADASTETGTLNLLDWFTGGATVAWGANGRVNSGGGYANFNASVVNNNAPYLYANTILVSDASPVVSVALTYSGGQHGNFFSISGNETGSWTPIALDPSTFNVKGIVPNAIPFPVTGTMDQGTNLAFNGNLATWFERGFVRTVSGAGLPDGTFDSFSQPTHHYQFADFHTNNAILIDTNHQSANIGLATPAAYSALAFLTAGGNEGSPNIMSNICIIQHQNGLNETNSFLAYDWFDNRHAGSIALQVNGRVNMAARSVNNVGNQGLPYMFETYFLLADVNSPVTNIMVQYFTAPSASSTTYIMAISAATGGIPAVVDAGPTPPSQTVLPGTNVSFTVHVTGTPPVGGFWEVDSGGGNFVPLTDGLDANGSYIIGSQTFTLSITNVQVADGTNYQFVAGNNFGTNNSPTATLIVTPETVAITPQNPVAYTGNDVPLTATVTAGPPLRYQWFVIDNSSISNVIANATNTFYTIKNVNATLSGFTYGVVVWNAYGTNSATTVLSVSDSAAFLAGDLSPVSAEAFVGATGDLCRKCSRKFSDKLSMDYEWDYRNRTKQQ